MVDTKREKLEYVLRCSICLAEDQCRGNEKYYMTLEEVHRQALHFPRFKAKYIGLEPENYDELIDLVSLKRLFNKGFISREAFYCVYNNVKYFMNIVGGLPK